MRLNTELISKYDMEEAAQVAEAATTKFARSEAEMFAKFVLEAFPPDRQQAEPPDATAVMPPELEAEAKELLMKYTAEVTMLSIASANTSNPNAATSQIVQLACNELSRKHNLDPRKAESIIQKAVIGHKVPSTERINHVPPPHRRNKQR